MSRGPCTWKEKHLDYEIETSNHQSTEGGFQSTWKEKHLDYEIETRELAVFWQMMCNYPWKEKHLDYEIETTA